MQNLNFNTFVSETKIMSENLKLSNQICFPVYSLAKEIVNQYRPLLDAIELTYPQYLVMMVLWEQGEQTVSEIGSALQLDSGTLTPLLKRLQQKDLVDRKRSLQDERVVLISLTEGGNALKHKAEKIPLKMLEAMQLNLEELETLKTGIEHILLKLKSNKS